MSRGLIEDFFGIGMCYVVGSGVQAKSASGIIPPDYFAILSFQLTLAASFSIFLLQTI
jgi:hypothetical protein